MTIPVTTAAKELADKGLLDAALQEEYRAQLESSLKNPGRLAATWGANFLVLERKPKMEAVLQTAMTLLGCNHGALNMIGSESVVLVGINSDSTTSRDVSESYCQHVVDGKPFMVSDAQHNSLVCKLPATSEIGLRCYIGVPVIFQNYVVGSLCVYDTVPRQWTPTDVKLLASLAFSVEALLS